MGTTVQVTGVNYTVPAYNESGWAQGSGNLSQMLIALAAAVATSPSFMQFANAASTPVAVTASKTYLVASNTLAVTLNLPAPAANFWFAVKDSGKNAAANNITIHRAASEQIDGVAADKVLSLNGEFLILMSDGTNWFTLRDPEVYSAGKGPTVTTPDGTHTWMLGVDNSGNVQATQVS